MNIDTFKTMDTMLLVYWILAGVASVIFVIQAIMTIIGFDSDADMDGGDADFDADGFHLFSVKTIICFVLGFGWTGVLFYGTIGSGLALGVLAGAVGLLFMLLIALLLRQVMRLDKDNTFRAADTVGLNADVYLRIPADRAETGKITISVHGSIHELEALADEAIPTGAKVRVVGVVEGDTVLVEKI